MMRPIRGWLVAVAVVSLGVLLAPALGANVKIGPADDYDPQIDPADFVDGDGDPLPIDNPYWPLVPGTTFVYEDEDGEELNEVCVTYDTKEILGVTCTVVYDVEWVEGELTEQTFDWYAQDIYGNIWYFGEYTEAYEDGEVSTEGSWEAGVDGALPGILILGDPEVGDSYRQEYYEDEAEDAARILKLNASVSTDLGEFSGCMKTKEWSLIEPGVIEHKFYAPGVGLVLIEELGEGKTLVALVEIN
jgi:hypothetical protein